MTKRIVRLSARDVLRLTAVEIEPNGDVITLGGRNGAGKSSVLNAIEMALGGKRATPAQPIRKGAERAEVLLDLGDLLVERVITAKSDRLVVKTPDGAKYGRPQELLNKMFTAISFDPLAFAKAEPGKQVATLRKLTGLDFAELDAERERVFDERRDVNRELKATKARLDSAPDPGDDVPTEEVSVAELMETLNERRGVVERNRERQAEARSGLEEAEDACKRWRDRVEELEAELAEAREDLRQAEEDRVACQRVAAECAKLDSPDLTEIEQQLREADTVNERVRQAKARADLAKAVAILEQSSQEKTDRIEAIDADKRAQLEAAKFPVEGLAFDADGVTFKGLPFEQASTAEQLRISVAIGIALQPELRVLFVRDGSLLDPDGLKLIEQLAREHDCQIWLEDARTSDPTAVIIEDGAVAGQAQAGAAE